ncbi:MAG: matrixin family metalloprotease [Ferruginibacter sp.]
MLIQPFNGLAAGDAAFVIAELKKLYPHVEIAAPVALPASCYNPARKRYRADSLISFLRKQTPAGYVTIGLTDKDISTIKDSIADWGVMGLGFCPGNACVASTFRLSKTEKRSQLFKVAIHEAGHTQGLPHCDVKSCFMRDTEGRNPTNEETAFCSKCRSLLQKKEWVFN